MAKKKKDKSKQIVFLLLVLVGAGIFFYQRDKSEIPPQAVPPGAFAPPYIQPPQQPPQPPEEQNSSKEEGRASITVDDCKKLLNHLAGTIGVRVSGTPAYEEQAAPWAKKFFEDCGLETAYQNVPSKNSKNVFAWIEGSNTNEIVVIGGHLDTVPRSPGADDNGTGSVAVIELAQAYSMIFKSKKPPRTILFQLYAAEESGLIGSRYYCNNPTFPRDNPDIKKHIYMLNFDMIGRSRQDGVANLAVFTEENMIGGSDHASFQAKGVPAEMNHTGLHQDYHKPSDTPDKINYEGMVQIIQKGFDTAWEKIHNGHNEYGAKYIDPRPIIHDHDIGDKFQHPFYLQDGLDTELQKAIIEQN